MIDIRRMDIITGSYGPWDFFYITEESERYERRGIGAQVVAISMGWADPIAEVVEDSK